MQSTMRATPFELVFGQPPRSTVFPGVSSLVMEEEVEDLLTEEGMTVLHVYYCNSDLLSQQSTHQLVYVPSRRRIGGNLIWLHCYYCTHRYIVSTCLNIHVCNIKLYTHLDHNSAQELNVPSNCTSSVLPAVFEGMHSPSLEDAEEDGEFYIHCHHNVIYVPLVC